MHNIRAQRRRENAAELERNARPRQVAAVPAVKKEEEKKEEGEGRNGGAQGQGQAAVEAVRADRREGAMQILAGWIRSTRFLSSIWFVFGLTSRFFHVFDALVETALSNFPSYMYCPMIAFALTSCFISLFGHADAHCLPQVMCMVTCCGVLAGAIMEEQLANGAGTLISTENFVWLAVACVVLSLNTHVLDYRMEGPIKKVLLSVVIVVVPSWVFVLYNIFPLSSIALQTVHISCFTLAVGIVEQVVIEVRNRVPLFDNVFPSPCIGCLVQSFGMIALSTYYTSCRQSLFSDSWFSFSWMVFAGAPLTVFTLVCHLIHWTSEKIFGPGVHNGVYMVRAVLLSWSVAMALHHFRPQTFAPVGNDVWRNPLKAARRLLVALGW